MSFSIGKILAIPALFFAFGVNPSYAQELPAKAKTPQFNEPEIKKEYQAINATVPKTQNTNAAPGFFMLQPDIFFPILLTLFGVAGASLIVSWLIDFSKDSNKISSLEDLIKQFDTNENHNPRIGIAKEVTISEDLLPEEIARLNSVLRFIRSVPEFDNIISDPSIRLYFDKSKDINQEIKEREPNVYSQLPLENYSSWKLKEGLKLKSFTFIENDLFNEPVNYVVVIEDYKDYETIFLSVLRELFRIQTYQNNENKIPVLYSLQFDTLQSELKSLEEMLDVLCKSSSKLEERIKALIDEEEKQLAIWRSVSSTYCIDMVGIGMPQFKGN